TDFPNTSERTSVSLLMADAYARENDSKNEFAIYDTVLQELAAKAQNVPLGMNRQDYGQGRNTSYSSPNPGDEDSGEFRSEQNTIANSRHNAGQSFQLSVSGSSPSQTTGPRSPEYLRVLERYLARLVEMKAIPSALAVFRREIDRNPDDPGLYERLATFL